MPRGIGVVVHHDAPRESREQLDLRLRKARAAARHHVRESRARHGNRVHVAFHQNAEIVLPQRFLRAIEMVQHVALRIDRRLGRVQILGHVVAHRAAAEGDHLGRFIRDGEHDAAAKAVVEPSALVAREKPRRLEQLFRVFRFQVAQQRVARRRRKAQPEAQNRLAIQAAIFQVGHGDAAFVAFVKLAREESRCFAMHLHQRRALLILAPLFGRPLARPRNRNAALLGHRADRFRKLALLHLHHEFENVAAYVAAEAVVHLLHRVHAERRRLLLVKRAQSREILPGLLQAHVFADDADNVRLLLHAFRK